MPYFDYHQPVLAYQKGSYYRWYARRLAGGTWLTVACTDLDGASFGGLVQVDDYAFMNGFLSSDGAATWAAVAGVTDAMHAQGVLVGGQAEPLVVAAPVTNEITTQRVAHDFLSFTENVATPTGYTVLTGFVDDLGVVHVALQVDGDDDHIYGVYYTRSLNYGLTWSVPAQVLAPVAGSPDSYKPAQGWPPVIHARAGKVSIAAACSFNWLSQGAHPLRLYGYGPFVMNTSLNNGLSWVGQYNHFEAMSAFDGHAGYALSDYGGDLFFALFRETCYPTPTWPDKDLMETALTIYKVSGWNGGAAVLHDSDAINILEDYYPVAFAWMSGASSKDGTANVIVSAGKYEANAVVLEGCYQVMLNGGAISYVLIDADLIDNMLSVNYPRPYLGGFGYTYFF